MILGDREWDPENEKTGMPPHWTRRHVRAKGRTVYVNLRISRQEDDKEKTKFPT